MLSSCLAASSGAVLATAFNSLPFSLSNLFTSRLAPAINLALIDECMVSLDSDGGIMQSATEKGTTRKASPCLGLLRDAQLAVRAYYKELSHRIALVIVLDVHSCTLYDMQDVKGNRLIYK